MSPIYESNGRGDVGVFCSNFSDCIRNTHNAPSNTFFTMLELIEKYIIMKNSLNKT